jgi:hypothetical protein
MQASWSSESLASYGLNTSTGLFGNNFNVNGSGSGKVSRPGGFRG